MMDALFELQSCMQSTAIVKLFSWGKFYFKVNSFNIIRAMTAVFLSFCALFSINKHQKSDKQFYHYKTSVD